MVLLAAACRHVPVEGAAAACRAAPVDVSRWRLEDRGQFSFRIPQRYTKSDVAGIDSEIERWTAGSRSIAYEFGGFPQLGDVRADPGVRDYSECREVIGGREATIAAWRVDRRYHTRAVWRQIPGTAWLLVWTSRSPDREGQLEALSVVRSVIIDPGP